MSNRLLSLLELCVDVFIIMVVVMLGMGTGATLFNLIYDLIMKFV